MAREFKLKNFVFASSSSVYANSSTIPFLGLNFSNICRLFNVILFFCQSISFTLKN